ncbi:MAG: hypothetical protein Q9224_004508 [Gallowayella concinna]
MVLVLEAIVCGTIVLASSAVVDRLYYQHWTFPPVRFLYFNLAQSLSVHYGRNDWHYYLFQGYPLLLTTFLPFALVGLYQSLFPQGPPSTQSLFTTAIKRQLATTSLLVPFILSFISHKEVRFIYPLLPPLHLLSAHPFLTFFFSPSNRTPRKRILFTLLLLANIFLAIFTTALYQQAPLTTLSYLRSRATDHPHTTTTIAFLTPCHSTPWRSHLIHPSLKAWALSCEPPLHLPPSEHSTYLDEADLFYQSPTHWLSLHLGRPPKNINEQQLRLAALETASGIPWNGESMYVDDKGRQRERRKAWTGYLVFFGQLEKELEKVLSGSGYGVCWRGWNGWGHEDWRRRGGMVIWCLDEGEKKRWSERDEASRRQKEIWTSKDEPHLPYHQLAVRKHLAWTKFDFPGSSTHLRRLCPSGPSYRKITIVALMFFLIAFYALDAVEPYHQHFSLRNYTLQYPFAVHERVPVPLLFALNSLLPAIIIALYALVIDGLFSHQKQAAPRDEHRTLGKYRLKDRLWEFNCGLLGLLLSQGAAFVITGALKNATGKPRPDLIDRCRPEQGSADPLVYGLSNISICTQENHKILKDGFRSFPSGHSSSAFAGLFYLSIYLAAKMHVLDNRGEVWKTFIVMIPTLAAALIAVSRIMDARHHPFDVISGSMLGMLVAWGAYRQYFPPVTESWRKGRAYPIRTWGSEPKRPASGDHALLKDEEIEPSHTEPIRSRSQTWNAPLQTNANGVSDGNVFREQISRSQHQRRQELGEQSSSSSLDLEARHPRKPLPGTRPQMRRVPSNIYASSSSDHETDDGFELQTRGGPRTEASHGGNLAADALGQEPSYHPSIPNPSKPTVNTSAGSGSQTRASLSPDMVRPPRNEAEERSSAEERRPRGVDLVETYR